MEEREDLLKILISTKEWKTWHKLYKQGKDTKEAFKKLNDTQEFKKLFNLLLRTKKIKIN